MTWTTRCIVGMAGFVLSVGVWATPLELSGIKVEDSTEVNGTKLPLNGAGIRYKAVFKVYVAALYLGKKAATPEEVYAAPGPKRISITLLRDIDSNELGKSFTKAFEENAPKAEMSKLIPGLIKQGQIFADQKKLVAGDNFTIDWVPGTGTVVSVKGKPQGEPSKEIEFFNAMTRIWLGSHPADWRLKEALLGKSS
ncbi:MAG: hypothetical protein HHJ16_16735 [Polaromonas sp.]|uniref:chalcone isomerase family protein n=1 Tax=Polaromonas sp. TaxID=1869339 RepID=UPI0017D91704|nr:chalcone isomerase family protein [Polaromonas sp.]NMM11901.1 hypothetical protein [Polaromonas sp.]